MKKLVLLFLITVSYSTITVAQQGMRIGSNAAPSEMLHVEGAIKIGTDFNNSAAAPSGGAGTIRWNSAQSRFEGWDGGTWVLLSSAGTDDQDLGTATLNASTSILSLSIEDGIGTSVSLAALEESADITQVASDLADHETADGDLSATNEIQVLGISGSTVTLTNGGGSITLPSDADWTISGNDQYSAVSGNVGIGLTNPTAPLHIRKDQNGQTSIIIENDNTSANSAERISFNNEDGGIAGIAVYDNDNGAYPSQMRIFNNRPSSSVHLINSGNPSNNSNLSLIDGGNVGIGTLTPDAKLEVNGQIKITGGTPGANKVLTSDANGLGAWVDPNTLVTLPDNLGNHTATENVQLNDNWLSNDGGDEGIRIDDSGNVGIGNDAPDYRLDVKGPGINQGPISAQDNIIARFEQSNTASGLGIRFRGYRNSSGNVSSFIDLMNFSTSEYIVARMAALRGTGEEGSLLFYTNSGSALTERMRINNAGTVQLNAYTTNGIVRATGGNGTLSTSGGGINLASEVTGVLPVANGGTGSSAQNFVDLTNAQTVAGIKTWSNNAIFNGNVGIGTSPAQKLSVAGTLGISEVGNNGNRLQISSTGSGAVINQQDNSPILFQTQASEKMRIQDNGNVGIGEVNPSSKLDVAGKTETAQLEVGGGSTISKMQVGQYTVGGGSNTVQTGVISFGTTFSAVPKVICTLRTETGQTYDDTFAVTTFSVTTTGFRVNVHRVNGSGWGQTLLLDWIAIQ